MATTSRPASDSGSTAVPPAAPSPITTTSACLWLCVDMLVAVLSVRLPACAAPQRVVDCGLVGRYHGDVELLLGLRVDHLDPGEPQQVPADEVRVAAVVGIAEHP